MNPIPRSYRTFPVSFGFCPKDVVKPPATKKYKMGLRYKLVVEPIHYCCIPPIKSTLW